MKIAILGYGKMGKEIESFALSRGHEIVLKINDQNLNELTTDNLRKADVAIEFSTPHTVLGNIEKCFGAGTPIVVGTTGWYDRFTEVKEMCLRKDQTLFYATNFSVGVNLFFYFNKQLAKLMKNYPQYKLSMDEIHHTQKLDAPSGTAITAAEGIMQEYRSKKKWINEIVTDEEKGKNTFSNEDELLIRSYREENVPGTHTVFYDSDVDTIEFSHIAHSRKGFASGAVTAAEWLVGKKGIYTMTDMLSFEK